MLFAAYGGGHVTMLRPVAKALPPELSIGFLGLTTAQADLEHHNVDYFGYMELEGADDAQVQAWGRELAGPETSTSAVPYAESVAYHGLNFRDLVGERGEAGARAHYALHGRQGFIPIKTMEALLAKLRPKVVVATNSPRSERALFEAARNLGIPSICVVDLFAIQEVAWISQPGYATRICVLNQQVADFLIKEGCEPASVIPTGNPAFDSIASVEARAAGQLLRQRRGLTNEDKVLLWASNVEPERHPFTGAKGNSLLPRWIEAELRKLVERENHLKLIVRYHPSENLQFVPTPNVTLSPREENLHALLNAVDAVVVLASTVGLEAHIAGRPVISVDSSVFTNDAPYSRMGISTGVSDIGELAQTVQNVLARGMTTTDDDFYSPSAAWSIAQQIVQMAKI